MAKINLLSLTLFGTFLLGIVSPLFAQNSKRYLVYLKNKENSPYSIQKPEEFLSARAINRRKNQDIKITTRDLPVNPNYLEAITNTGAKIWYSSKWMNAVLIESDQNTLLSVQSLDFVKPDVLLVSKIKAAKPSLDNPKAESSEDEKIPETLVIESEKYYGDSYTQVRMLGADQMHQMGFRGKDMLIGIFDSGFINAHKVSFLKHLFDNQRITYTYDFVENEPNVFDDGSHGLQVLSTIAAYKPGALIGTAPEASFCLFRTEDPSSEYRIEEVNWLMAAEKADSAGVDVINSSLGYTTFSDSSMDYEYDLLDGNSTFVTKAADLAAATGMLVVTSAGNEGNNSWGYVGAPADADSVLSVGAVSPSRKYVDFSSKGPTKDGRIRPNVSALGLATIVGSTRGQITLASGTSFASPLICGLAAGFWQAHPELSNMEVIDILQKSSTQADNPDNFLGYGIPDFEIAHKLALEYLKKSK